MKTIEVVNVNDMLTTIFTDKISYITKFPDDVGIYMETYVVFTKESYEDVLTKIKEVQ